MTTTTTKGNHNFRFSLAEVPPPTFANHTHIALTNSPFQIGFFKKIHLYPGLAELCPLRQLLPGVDVWVLSPLKGLLKLVQLGKIN